MKNLIETIKKYILNNGNISPGVIQRLYEERLEEKKSYTNVINIIEKYLKLYYNLSIEDLKLHTKRPYIALPRWAVTYILYRHTNLTMEKIADKIFANMISRSALTGGIIKIRKKTFNDITLFKMIDVIEKELDNEM